MLWNWYTVDACFLAESWHVKNNGMFAVSCIGVAFLVVGLEVLRRIGKEYDTAILRQFQRNISSRLADLKRQNDSDVRYTEPAFVTFRATPLQQFIRSLIHAVTFGVAYIIMLLAMYFNGYIIISIIIGAFLGKFFCDWMVQKIPLGKMVGGSEAQGIEETTVCCG
jgi:copper transporter 1